MEQTKFSYPEIPYIVDRNFYDYLVEVDKVLKQLAMAINRIEERIA